MTPFKHCGLLLLELMISCILMWLLTCDLNKAYVVTNSETEWKIALYSSMKWVGRWVMRGELLLMFCWSICQHFIPLLAPGSLSPFHLPQDNCYYVMWEQFRIFSDTPRLLTTLSTEALIIWTVLVNMDFSFFNLKITACLCI